MSVDDKFDKWIETYVLMLETHAGKEVTDIFRRAATVAVGVENTPAFWPPWKGVSVDE